MVHADEGQAARPGHRLGCLHRHQQRAHQARTAGDGDRVDVVERGAGLGQRRLHHRDQVGDVVARRDLGNDAAERGVDGHL
jgi:hypothetical protein